MASKRRKHRLGSPPDAHVKRASAEYGAATEYMAKASKHITAKDCGAAMAAIKRASLHAGAASAEAEGGVGSSKAMKPELAKLSSLVERFKGVCLKSKREITQHKRRR